LAVSKRKVEKALRIMPARRNLLSIYGGFIRETNSSKFDHFGALVSQNLLNELH